MPTFGLSVRLQSKGGYELKCGKLDLNDVEGPHRLVQALTQIIADPTVWNRLEVHRELYFQTPDGSSRQNPVGTSSATVNARPFTLVRPTI
jgi:hypothetical protein